MYSPCRFVVEIDLCTDLARKLHRIQYTSKPAPLVLRPRREARVHACIREPVQGKAVYDCKLCCCTSRTTARYCLAKQGSSGSMSRERRFRKRVASAADADSSDGEDDGSTRSSHLQTCDQTLQLLTGEGLPIAIARG